MTIYDTAPESPMPAPGPDTGDILFATTNAARLCRSIERIEVLAGAAARGDPASQAQLVQEVREARLLGGLIVRALSGEAI